VPASATNQGIQVQNSGFYPDLISESAGIPDVAGGLIMSIQLSVKENCLKAG
jgi:hypothetical protein